MSNNISNKKYKIFDLEFDSYGEALSGILKDRGLSNTWLAKKLFIEGQKPSFASLRSMISRWIAGEPLGLEYQNKINAIFDFTIKQKNNGRWAIIRTELTSNESKGHTIPLAHKPNRTIEEKLRDYESRKDVKDVSDTERDLLLEYLLNHAESLSEGLRRLVEIEKNRAD